MDWENERYVRYYVRETVDDAMLSWEALALWRAMLTKFDRAGVLEMGRHGWRGVAVLVRMPPEVVKSAAEELLVDGRVEQHGEYLVAPNFMAAQEAKQSDKQRQAESRARRRDATRAKELLGLDVTNRDILSREICGGDGDDEASQSSLVDHVSPDGDNVTIRDPRSQPVTTTSQNVTKSHNRSHGVTPSLAVPSLAEREGALPPVLPAPPSRRKRKKPNIPLPDEWTPTDSHRQLAKEHGIPISLEAEKFRNHHLAKGTTMVDWNRAFNTWLYRAQDYAGKGGSPRSTPSKPGGGLPRIGGDK